MIRKYQSIILLVLFLWMICSFPMVSSAHESTTPLTTLTTYHTGAYQLILNYGASGNITTDNPPLYRQTANDFTNVWVMMQHGQPTPGNPSYGHVQVGWEKWYNMTKPCFFYEYYSRITGAWSRQYDWSRTPQGTNYYSVYYLPAMSCFYCGAAGRTIGTVYSSILGWSVADQASYSAEIGIPGDYIAGAISNHCHFTSLGYRTYPNFNLVNANLSAFVNTAGWGRYQQMSSNSFDTWDVRRN